MSETGPELSQAEQELVSKTTDTLQFKDRRHQTEKSPADEITDVKQLLDQYTSQFSSRSVDTSNGLFILDPNKQHDENNDSQSLTESDQPTWEALDLPDVDLDYDTFIGELIHQQKKVLREQSHNFGDLATAKQLLFPTVLRYTSELLVRQKEINELEKEVYKDGLTELLNQKYFENRFSSHLDEEIENGRDLAVLFIDTDRFKIMNDTLGHKYGDDVLKIVANILNTQVRDLDLVIRKGGDEFAILLKNIKSEKALEIAERLRVAAEQSQMPDVPENMVKPALTFSIGVSTSDSAKSSEEFQQQAEIAMYHSKRTADGQDRRNAVTNFVPGMTMPKGGDNERSSHGEPTE